MSNTHRPTEAERREILNARHELSRRYIGKVPARVWIVEAEIAALSKS
jgi:hypothetical protein